MLNSKEQNYRNPADAIEQFYLEEELNSKMNKTVTNNTTNNQIEMTEMQMSAT